ncbi:hypothetical protein GCM10018965_058650 [Nonomuraea roseola]
MVRHYDLRHAGVTGRRCPGGTVAERAGHSVEVVRRIHHRCMFGYDDVWIDRMDHARQKIRRS